MTLIEVMAGLVVLGTVLAMILVARGRYLRQTAAAARRLQAIQAADQLMKAWWRPGQPLPQSDVGAIVGDTALSWRTRVMPDPIIERLGGRVVRLEILDEQLDAAASPLQGEPLARVDVVVPSTQPSGDAGER